MKPRTVSKLLTSSFFSLLVSSLKYIPICTYICWKVSGRFCWELRDGEACGLSHLFPFFTLGLLITGIISDRERTPPEQCLSSDPRLAGGSRAPAPRSPGVRREERGWSQRQPRRRGAGPARAADGAGGAVGAGADGRAPDGSGSPGPVQVAWADSGPAGGAGEGGQRGWGGDPRFP